MTLSEICMFHYKVFVAFPVVLGASADFSSGEAETRALFTEESATPMIKFKALSHCPRMLNHPSTFPSP